MAEVETGDVEQSLKDPGAPGGGKCARETGWCRCPSCPLGEQLPMMAHQPHSEDMFVHACGSLVHGAQSLVLLIALHLCSPGVLTWQHSLAVRGSLGLAGAPGAAKRYLPTAPACLC